MKSLHVVYGFYPEPVGGTEVYAAALAAELVRLGHPAVIAAPGPHEQAYEHNSLPVRRFALASQVDDVRQLYDEGDQKAAESFLRILDAERFDIVHMHAFTRACSLRLVRAAKSRGLPVVLTYHTPTVSCVRGTLMEAGITPCDGVLDVRRCSACGLHGKGLPMPLAQAIASLPPLGSHAYLPKTGKISTVLRFSSFVANRHEITRALFSEVDKIVAPRVWVRELLAANGVARAKIVQAPQALCRRPSDQPRPSARSSRLRVLFLGRLDPGKGLDVLLRAVARMDRDLDFELTIHTTVQSDEARRELSRLQTRSAHDRRVAIRPSVPSEQVISTIAEHDLLAVPSQLMETGPLVVLEAFAAGVPVIASSLGGLTELVESGVNGVLVGDFSSPDAWAAALDDLCRHRQKLAVLASNINPPLTMDTVAGEMLDVYYTLCSAGANTTTASPLLAR